MIEFTKDLSDILESLQDDMMIKQKTPYLMSDMYAFYYRKKGTTYLQGVDETFIGKYLPDDTKILIYPLLLENKADYRIMAKMTTLKDIYNIDDVVDTEPKSIIISKKSDYIFENVE